MCFSLCFSPHFSLSLYIFASLCFYSCVSPCFSPSLSLFLSVSQYLPVSTSVSPCVSSMCFFFLNVSPFFLSVTLCLFHSVSLCLNLLLCVFLCLPVPPCSSLFLSLSFLSFLACLWTPVRDTRMSRASCSSSENSFQAFSSQASQSGRDLGETDELVLRHQVLAHARRSIRFFTLISSRTKIKVSVEVVLRLPVD